MVVRRGVLSTYPWCLSPTIWEALPWLKNILVPYSVLCGWWHQAFYFIWVPIVESVEAYLVCDSISHYKNCKQSYQLTWVYHQRRICTYIHTYIFLWSHHVMMCIAASREKQLKYFRRLDQKSKPCHFESSKRLPRLTPAEAQDAEVLTWASHCKATMVMIVFLSQ